jgi:hypothetical protein
MKCGKGDGANGRAMMDSDAEEASKVGGVQCGSHPVAANQALWLRLLHSLAAE